MEHHVKEDDDFAHRYVKMFCNVNQFPWFKFVVHTQNTMVSEDRVNITIVDLTQK